MHTHCEHCNIHASNCIRQIVGDGYTLCSNCAAKYGKSAREWQELLAALDAGELSLDEFKAYNRCRAENTTRLIRLTRRGKNYNNCNLIPAIRAIAGIA